MADQKWAPLIYARTLKVDFRLLAIPAGVTSDDLNWLRECIHGTTVFADELRDSSRHSLFQNERYRVFGITCMASLLGDQATIGSRELYLFAGYVSASQPKPCAVPPLDALNRTPYRVFRPLYRHVERHWRDDRMSLETDHADEISHEFTRHAEIDRALHEHPLDPRSLPGQSRLNADPSRLRIFPAGDAAAVWTEAALSGRAGSLCVGLSGVTAALRTPFLNVGVTSIRKSQDVDRAAALNAARQHHQRGPIDHDQTGIGFDLWQTSDGGEITEAGEHPPVRKPPRSGLGNIVGALFGRRGPKAELTDMTADGVDSEDASRENDSPDTGPKFTRPWQKGEDPDGWIDYGKS